MLFARDLYVKDGGPRAASNQQIRCNVHDAQQQVQVGSPRGVLHLVPRGPPKEPKVEAELEDGGKEECEGPRGGEYLQQHGACRRPWS